MQISKPKKTKTSAILQPYTGTQVSKTILLCSLVICCDFGAVVLALIIYQLQPIPFDRKTTSVRKARWGFSKLTVSRVKCQCF
jgi:hypothetical protein